MMIKERKPESGAELYRKLQKENHELADCNARLLDQVGAATKRTIELEKENEQLKSAAEFQQSSNMKRHFEIQELKKENAELKEEIDKKQNLADVRLEQELETYQKLHIKSKEKLDTEIALDEVKDQLTKAKEIISEFVEWANWEGSKCPSFKSIQAKAEQFLEETE